MAEWGESRVEAANAKARAVKALVASLNAAIYDAAREGVTVEIDTIEHALMGSTGYVHVTAKTSLTL